MYGLVVQASPPPSPPPPPPPPHVFAIMNIIRRIITDCDHAPEYTCTAGYRFHMLHALSPTNLVACERVLFPFTGFRGGGEEGEGLVFSVVYCMYMYVILIFSHYFVLYISYYPVHQLLHQGNRKFARNFHPDYA